MNVRPRRGRPKGSGIDDSKTLAKIAKLIAKDPDMKRTTAIKRIGITNASIIRRLRDKFNESANTLIKQAGGKPMARKMNGVASSSKTAAKTTTAKKAVAKKPAAKKAVAKKPAAKKA